MLLTYTLRLAIPLLLSHYCYQTYSYAISLTSNIDQITSLDGSAHFFVYIYIHDVKSVQSGMAVFNYLLL